jgi:hypothetical protein
MMAYDEYLDWGLPIATGMVESACKSVVKNRMEGCGMRWSLEGAEAMLRLRSVYLSEDWPAYWRYHVGAERNLLHGRVLRMIPPLRRAGYARLHKFVLDPPGEDPLDPRHLVVDRTSRPAKFRAGAVC